MSAHASIDPGRSTGVAIYANSGMPICAKLDDPSANEILVFCEWLIEHGFTTLIVEDQHLPRPRIVAGKIVWPINWPALKTLILIADRWVCCGELAGMDVERVKPAEWQGTMLASAPKERDGKAQTTKQRAKAVVDATWDTVRRWTAPDMPGFAVLVPASKLPHDVCDAVLIGRWWALHGSKRS